MNKLEMVEYYKTWNGTVMDFWNMLSKKAYFSSQTNQPIYIAGKLRNEREAEQILILADDMIQAGELK